MTPGDGLHVYLALLAAGFAVSAPWRLLGVYLSRDLSPDSELLVWVRLVSAALIAGLVTRMMIFPAGALATVPLPLTIASFAAGLAVFVVMRRNLGAGLFAAVAVLVALQYAFGG